MPKTRIAVDGNEANVAGRVGTGEYSYRLLRSWSSLAGRNLTFDLYLRDAPLPDLPVPSEFWRYHLIKPRQAWTRFSLPLNLALNRGQYDAFWNPAHYLPPVTFCPSVVTIHDLAYEFFPDLFLSGDLYKLKHWTKQSVKQATKIIAVSHSTKADLVKLYGVAEDKIIVVHNGYDAESFNLKKPVSLKILESYQLVPQNYLLFLGTVQPRKNVTKLIQAFRLLKSSGYQGKLVIAGKIGWLAEETLSVIKNSEDASDIVMTGYISPENQTALYRHADVFVLPSLYEGFGVPVLEAMACGVPVAAASNSSLPEVVGDAGLLFNASDPAELSEVILKLKKDRPKWVKKGLSHVRNFSWDKCAKETLAVLQTTAK